MIRRPPRSTLDRSSAASDVYKRQAWHHAQVSNGPTEAINNLVKRVKRVAFCGDSGTSPTTGSEHCSTPAAPTGTYSQPSTPLKSDEPVIRLWLGCQAVTDYFPSSRSASTSRGVTNASKCHSQLLWLLRETQSHDLINVQRCYYRWRLIVGPAQVYYGFDCHARGDTLSASEASPARPSRFDVGFNR